MNTEATQALAALCWANPFGDARCEIEKRILGTAYKPVQQAGGRGVFSPNLALVLRQCEEALSRGNVFPEFAEIAAFAIYHELSSDLDGLISGKTAAQAVWRKFIQHWRRYFPPDSPQPEGFDQKTLFALFYQIRRAFHWIFIYVIGSSEDAIRMKERIWESIFSFDLKRYVRGFHQEMNDIHSLITGPSGSGKGLVAKAIGMSRFIPFSEEKETFLTDPATSYFSVNIAVLPEQLLESVLFGHAKGAFTGAYSDHAGLFESTGPHGVLFLDEIGEASGAAQAKLLTVLQDRQFQRVGETRSRTARCRVITATNRNLEEQVANKKFREDLYFRLTADRIETVSLSRLIAGKTGALKPMVIHITSRLLKESWTPDVVDLSLQFIDKHLGPGYPWPGNFRELEQCLRNFLIHQDYAPIRFKTPVADSLEAALIEKKPAADALLRLYAKALYKESGSYKSVGKVLGVDQRTAKKYVD